MNLNFTESGCSVERPSGFFKQHPVLFFAMRVSLFYLALLTGSMDMLLAGTCRGQSITEIEVTVGMRKGETLESLFKNIEKQSGLLFAFNDADINQYTDIQLPMATRTIKETLDIVLKGTGLG
jgi:TonB-dependent starch-binding outer membrane protein SusC